MKNNACKRVSTNCEAIELLSSENPEISMDRGVVKNLSGRQRAWKISLMDRPICREAVKVKPRNLDRRGMCRDFVEKLWGCRKEVFQGEKHIGDECNKQYTQTKIQSTC